VEGKIAKLKQEYFFVAATTRDIVQRYLRIRKERSSETVVWSDFSNFNSIHVNDSATALAPIELFRILIDE
jgi:starch phosphorylase